MHRVFVAAMVLMTTAFAKAEPVFAGVDANYSLGMEKEGRTWKWTGRADDLFRGMAAQGVRGFRVRLWTGDEGPNGKNYATEIALENDAPATPWKKQIASIEPAKKRLALFASEPAAPFVAEALTAAQAQEIETAIHPTVADQPLKFGRSTGASPSTAEPE